VYSTSVATSGYAASEVLRTSLEFFVGMSAFSSEFTLTKFRLMGIGIGACLGIQRAFERVSLLRAGLLAFVPAWLLANVCYELEIEPPAVNLMAAGFALFFGGGSGIVGPEVVDWGVLLVFFVAMWGGELVFARAENTNAFRFHWNALLIVALLGLVLSLAPAYTVYDALRHAQSYDEPLVLPQPGSFVFRHVLAPAGLASLALVLVYAIVHRFAPAGNSALLKLFSVITGAPLDAPPTEQRGAQDAVKSSGVRRGEATPPPEH
jgi:hypothetical protein